jgi:hypothetical protein
MTNWHDLKLDPDRRTLRQFAALWILFFSLATFLQLVWRHNPTAALAAAVLAVTLGPMGLVWPQAMKWIYVTWMVVAFPIGWVVSWTALAVLFFGIFTPIAFVQRMIGRDALRRRKPDAASYWIARAEPRDAASYFRQA